MQVDFLTLACVCDHLDRLLGARVQQVILPDNRSVALELYAGQRLYVLLSAQTQAPRLLLVPEKPRRGVEVGTPLALLLSKWVLRARLVDITQPPWERVLVFHFDGRAGECQLVVELIGRYSNVVLVGPDGCVLEAVKHVGPKMNRYRMTLPAHPYQLPPPPPNRSPPTGLTASDWTSRLSQAPLDEPLHRWLVGQLLGMSPIAAREIAARATGDPEALVRVATPQVLRQVVEELFAPLENGWWAPHIALDETGSVVAFTAYKPQQFDRVEPTKDISQAMWRFFEARGMTDPYAAARQAVQMLIDKARVKLETRLERIREGGADEDVIQRLRVAGELLLTYQHSVRSGASEMTLADYSGDPFTIALDPRLTPVENAQIYFRRYDKARRAAEQIPGLIDDVRVERAYLDQLDADLSLAETRPEIDSVRDALVAAGWARKGRQKTMHVSGPRRFDVQGFPVFVGRNAEQNEYLTFERAGPEDLWLHVRGLPGSHVIVKRGGQEVSEDVIRRAAQLAVYYSRARDERGKVAVDVTERRFVHRMRGKYPGMVTYRNERTVWVREVTKEAVIQDSSSQ